MRIKTGDKVAYSVQFLESIGQSHTDLAHDRGVVVTVKDYGKHLILATIKWEHNSPERVNVDNLAIVGLNSRPADFVIR